MKCNREQRQENGKQKQTIDLMRRSTNREMTNILLQVHALQLMRINASTVGGKGKGEGIVLLAISSKKDMFNKF